MGTTTTAARRTRARINSRRLVAVLAAVLLALAGAGYLGISAYVADRLSRPARNPPVNTPANYGLQYEDVKFNTAVDNIPLSGWYIHSAGQKVIVMLHGRDFSREANGGLEKAAILAQHGYDVFMFDFRAHGFSGGERYAYGQWETRDIAGALDYLKGRGVPEVGMYGISMGAATALLTAAERPEIKAVMAESSYSDLYNLIGNALPRESGLPRFFNPGIVFMANALYGMDLSQPKPVRAIEQLGDRPVLLVHSVEDEFVPVSDAYELQKAGGSNPNLALWVVPKGAHCEAFSTYKQEYTQRMLAFYDANIKPYKAPEGLGTLVDVSAP